MNFYRTESSYPLPNAQSNLMGRTHYVDPDTLRFHKSRVLSSHVVDQGMLFAIVESVAANFDGSGRGFRYVIFDIFGTVLGERSGLDELYKSRATATKAMWAELNTMDAKAITLAAIDREQRNHSRECDDTRAKVQAISMKAAA